MATNLVYNGQEYNITDLQYPEDLDSSEQYGQNKVVFLINVTSESKIRKDQSAGTVRDIPPSEYKVTAGKRVADAVLETASKLTKEAGEYIGVAVDIPKELKVFGKMKRLTSAISLYIPNDLSMGYNVSYAEEDLATSELVMQTIGDMGKAIADKKGFGVLGSAASGILTAVAKSAALSSSAAQKALRATPGNAKEEQLFKRVEFRTFNFNYSFAPKSAEEAKKVLNIIRTFRHHMLPEFTDETQFIYVYPSEFEIKYYRGAAENPYLEKHFTAVLTSCNINYTPNGQFVTFEDGMPTQINMSLVFKELALPTKETSPDNKSGT